MRSIPQLALLTWFALVACATAVTPPAREFSRYQPIIDRMPFGGGPETVSSAQPGFATRFTLVGMVSAGFSAGKLQAILLDKSARNKTYFRSEGETIDGVKIVKINAELPQRSVVLQQGLETATLNYEAPRAVPVAAPAATTPTPGTASPVATPMPPRRIPFRR